MQKYICMNKELSYKVNKLCFFQLFGENGMLSIVVQDDQHRNRIKLPCNKTYRSIFNENCKSKQT